MGREEGRGAGLTLCSEAGSRDGLGARRSKGGRISNSTPWRWRAGVEEEVADGEVAPGAAAAEAEPRLLWGGAAEALWTSSETGC